MDFTQTLALQHKISPFNVLQQDKDRVIMLINYFIEKSEQEQPEAATQQTAAAQPRKYDDFWNF